MPMMRHKLPQVTALLIVAALLTCVPSAQAMISPAGSQVVGQSRADYVIQSNLQTSFSNTTTTTVLPVYVVSLTPPGTVMSPAFTLQGYEGDTLYADFLLENLGNANDSLVVGNAIIPPSSIGLSQVIFFDDVNSNSRFDLGEDDPAFLALTMGETRTLSVAFILETAMGAGDSYVEVQASSANDPMQPLQTSVARIVTLGARSATLHIGPFRNAEALPGGEGSPDDVSTASAGFNGTSVTFRNDITNRNLSPDLVEVQLADSLALPPGFTVTFQDTTGRILQAPPVTPNAALFGVVNAGETRLLLTTISSTNGSFFDVLGDSLSVDVLATSALDTSRTNQTTNRVLVPAQINTNALLRLDQTFRQNTAAFGDIATLVVSVQNMSDSIVVDSVNVFEDAQASLNFLSSPSFTAANGSLVWRVGSLMPGERRQGVIKFIVNSRVKKGETKAFGHVRGVVISGAPVAAGPITNVLQIENDIFSDEGVILGEVFVDANKNATRDDGEVGVGGVAVYVESGEHALTDSLGRFSLPRIFEGYRVVRLDPRTLPSDVRMQIDERGEVNDTRLVHLLASGHAVVSFPVDPIIVEVKPDSVTRRIKLQELVTVNKRSRLVYQLPAVPSSYFEIGKAFLKPNHVDLLAPIRSFLSQHADWVVLLEGHTDSIPIDNDDFASNEDLSIARASSVMRYLTASGVERDHVIVKGYGDTQPVASNKTREGRARNRRVEITFMPEHLRGADQSAVQRVQAEIQQLGELPDTLQVRVIWELTTDSAEPLAAKFELNLPDAISVIEKHIRCDSLVAQAGESTFVTERFQRSQSLRCDLLLEIAETDTAVLEDVAALLRVAARKSENGDNWTQEFGIGLGDGRMRGQTHDLTLREWQEIVVATNDSASAPILVVEKIAASDESPDSVGAFGFVFPTDGQVFSKSSQIAAQVHVPLGALIEVKSGDSVVPDTQIGQRIIRTDTKVEDVTFYGVAIRAGWNTLVVTIKPIDGPTKTDTVRVAMSGRPVQMTAQERRVILPADGTTAKTLRFAVLDSNGLPVVDGITCNVVEGAQVLSDIDADPTHRGLQVTTVGGYAVLHVEPGTLPGRHTIRVETEGLTAFTDVTYTAPLRPMFLSGILEGLLGVYNARGEADPLGIEHFDDGVSVDGDSRFFLQGTTYAGINLTARVDSKSRYKDPLLKTLNPDRQYAIYGDSSELRYAAPSEGGNYIALEKDESFVRYGDFETGFESGEFLKFKRVSTGLTGALVSGDRRVKGFVTQTDLQTVKDEIPGDGTSGFYYLSGSPVVENSVNIVIEIRDRFQPERIIEILPQALNRDYTVNYFNGAVLFKEPIPVRSDDFNPVTIVAIYEVETTQKSDYIYGVRGELAETDRYLLGTTAVAKSGSDIGYALYGVNGRARLGALNVLGEVARSDDDIAGDGNAYQIEGSISGERSEHSAYFRRVDGDFLNPSFSGATHELFSRKAGFKSRFESGEKFLFESDGFHHEFAQNDDKKQNLLGLATYKTPLLRFSGGLRAATQTQSDQKRDGLLSVVGFGAQQPGGIEFRTQWEKNLGDDTIDDYPDRLKSRLTFPLVEKLKVVANHEYLSAHGRPGTQRLLAGLESDLGAGLTAFTKYSLSQTASDERLGAASGLRQKVRLRDHLSASVDIEGFRSFSNALNDEYVALKTGLNWQKPGSGLAEGQYELRWQRASTRHFWRVNAAREFGGGLSLVLRDALSFTQQDGRDNSLSADGRLAGVFRPRVGRFKSLFMLKNEYDRFSPVDPEAIIWKLVFSADLNLVPSTQHELRLKLAVKYVEDFSIGLSETSSNHLILSQYVYRFAKDWDSDLWGRFLGQNGAGTRQYGAGIEIGRMLFGRVRVSGGYSINGFEERDLAENDAWSSGFGVRVQLVLSDWILNELGMHR